MDSTTESTPVDLDPHVPQINGTIHQTPDSNSNPDPPAPAPAPAQTPPRSSPSRKGYGLKKWRRIPRNNLFTPTKEIETEITDKDRDSDSDSIAGRMLKRGSSNILNPNDSTPPSVNDLFAPNNDSAAVAAKFNAGDSDYSEDRGSSKSSTAASAPKFAVRGSRDKNARGKSASSKNSNQRVLVNKSHSDSSKKAKDDATKLEFDKERESSPISSFESDSRSCNSVLVPPSAPNVDRDGSVSPPSEQQSDQQQQQQQQQERVAEFSDQLSSSVNQGNCKVDYIGDCDPLVDSILLLQSAQLALQAEVQKFGEIGKGICSLYDDSDKTSGVAVDAVVHMANGSMCDGCTDNGNLSKSVQTLERQLNEAECSLKDKDLRIAELEATLRSMESPQDHVKITMEQQYKRCTEMEAELQVLFRQKLEAEILSVVMTRSSKDLSVLVKDRSFLAEEPQSPRMMVDVENKDGQPEKLDTSYIGEEIREMHRGVNKLTKCFVIQLFLLFVVITLFVFQLAPKSAVVVPT